MRLQLRDDTDLEKLMSVLTGPLFRVFDINLRVHLINLYGVFGNGMIL